MTSTFPYIFVERTDFGDLYSPFIPVRIFDLSQHVSVDVMMLTDSGADYTMLPRFVATYLGISFELDCVKSETKGVGGVEEVYFVKQKMKFGFGKLTVQAPVAFFNHNRNPGLIGRLGFMDQFKVVFNRHKVEFIDK